MGAENLDAGTLLVGMENGVALGETGANPEKAEDGITIQPAIPHLEAYPGELNTQIQTDICMPMFIKALLTTAKWWKQPGCPPTGEWINKCSTGTQWNIIQP